MRNLAVTMLAGTMLAGCAATGEDAGAPQEANTSQVFSFVDNNGLVFFDSGSARLNRVAVKVLDALDPPERFKGFDRVDIIGHTDRTGSAVNNLRLSLRRAETVRNALVARGAPEALFIVRGIGETDPLVPTADGVAEPQNRFVGIYPR